jgi:hypothetical protein
MRHQATNITNSPISLDMSGISLGGYFCQSNTGHQRKKYLKSLQIKEQEQ